MHPIQSRACIPAIYCLIHDKQDQIQIFQHSLLLDGIPAAVNISRLADARASDSLNRQCCDILRIHKNHAEESLSMVTNYGMVAL